VVVTEAATVGVTEEATVVVMLMLHLAAPPTVHPTAELAAVVTMAISSVAGQVGPTANVTSGIPSGIAGIRTDTTGRAGTFAELTIS
jgi:hypothetical protein